MIEKNALFLTGEIIKIEESHIFMDEKFYRFIVQVERLSGNCDILPVIVSEKLLYNNEIKVGDYVSIEGQIRTKNQKENDRKRLLVFGYALDIKKISKEEAEALENRNTIDLIGYVVKTPVYRETKTGRKITELLIASNRPYNKSDYIPSIAWGVESVYARNFEVGDKVELSGRFQSRDYIARDEHGNPITRTTYEISISNIKVLDNNRKKSHKETVNVQQ